MLQDRGRMKGPSTSPTWWTRSPGAGRRPRHSSKRPSRYTTAKKKSCAELLAQAYPRVPEGRGPSGSEPRPLSRAPGRAWWAAFEEVQRPRPAVLVRAEPGAPGSRPRPDPLRPAARGDEPRGGLHAATADGGLLKLVCGGPDQSTIDLRLVKAEERVLEGEGRREVKRRRSGSPPGRKIGSTPEVRGGLGMAPLRAAARGDLGRQTEQVQRRDCR